MCSSYYQDSVCKCEYMDINANHYLCRTCHSVSTAAGGAEKLLPHNPLTFIPPKEGFTALSFVDLLTPILIQRKTRLEPGKQNCSGPGISRKEHGKGATWQEVHSNRTSYIFFGGRRALCFTKFVLCNLAYK